MALFDSTIIPKPTVRLSKQQIAELESKGFDVGRIHRPRHGHPYRPITWRSEGSSYYANFYAWVPFESIMNELAKSKHPPDSNDQSIKSM